MPQGHACLIFSCWSNDCIRRLAIEKPDLLLLVVLRDTLSLCLIRFGSGYAKLLPQDDP